MAIGVGVVGSTGGAHGLCPQRGPRGRGEVRGAAPADGALGTVWLESVLKLVLRGSDALVLDLYRRLRADQAVGPELAPGDGPTKSWRQLAGRAVDEGALTQPEARRLLRSVFTHRAA